MNRLVHTSAGKLIESLLMSCPGTAVLRSGTSRVRDSNDTSLGTTQQPNTISNANQSGVLLSPDRLGLRNPRKLRLDPCRSWAFKLGVLPSPNWVFVVLLVTLNPNVP